MPMVVMSLLLLFLVPSALAIVTALFAVALGRPQLAAVRRVLAVWRYRWLAYLIPFSPAASYLMMASQFPGGAVWIRGLPFIGLGTSITSASFAAVWLCLPDDSARRIRIGYAVLLAIVLWLLDLIAFGGIGMISR